MSKRLKVILARQVGRTGDVSGSGSATMSGTSITSAAVLSVDDHGTIELQLLLEQQVCTRGAGSR